MTACIPAMVLAHDSSIGEKQQRPGSIPGYTAISTSAVTEENRQQVRIACDQRKVQ